MKFILLGIFLMFAGRSFASTPTAQTLVEVGGDKSKEKIHDVLDAGDILYYLQTSKDSTGTTLTEIYSIPESGGTPTLVNQQKVFYATNMLVHNGTFYMPASTWTGNGIYAVNNAGAKNLAHYTDPGTWDYSPDLYTDGKNIYWPDCDDQGKFSEIKQVPLLGGSTKTLWTSPDTEPYISPQITGDGNYIYYQMTYSGKSPMRRIPINGGLAKPISFAQIGLPEIYGNYLYWVESSSGIRRVPAKGGPVENLSVPKACWPEYGTGLMFGNGSLYFLEDDSTPSAGVFRCRLAQTSVNGGAVKQLTDSIFHLTRKIIRDQKGSFIWIDHSYDIYRLMRFGN